MVKWNGVIQAKKSDKKGRKGRHEKNFLQWARQEGYFAFGGGWPDYCLVKLRPGLKVHARKLRPQDIQKILLVEVKDRRRNKLGRSQEAMSVVLKKAGLEVLVSIEGQPPSRYRTSREKRKKGGRNRFR